ncbi:archaeal ribosomal protein S17P protein [Entamoeba nuttalli P19]|uniref:Archaeal ribosomal protein S17P protein n=1 Tax=Entamoeba nuttalli (strain P19) TaxID=1076696 RepID=K2GSW3_ENTNP|nr:archaeal ribosomal protein S17P protein [Entamoeba nuttalli P19]EKE36942.1 archaeal ribosomal protein S17P protein [Entamoeba nuttalli P19]|eukprot:XP_008860719.1 archaeal ribosomal protein S17P protein [Entamoeba nuttalli P19]
MAEQTERAYQKQVFHHHSRNEKGEIDFGSVKRYHKQIGMGFVTPAEAIKGTYIDKKCPFTSDVSIRGRTLSGIVKSCHMKRTIIVRRDYFHYVSKYQRYEKRHKNIAVHCSPAFRQLKEGDHVVIGQCRPLSKTVRFNVLKFTSRGTGDKKQFAIF